MWTAIIDGKKYFYQNLRSACASLKVSYKKAYRFFYGNKYSKGRVNSEDTETIHRVQLEKSDVNYSSIIIEHRKVEISFQ